MSIEAVAWALSVPVGGNAKVILLGLANHAHNDGTEAYPSLDTLATYAHCDRSTARRNVRRLEADGWIAADGVGPRGQTKYRLAMGEPFSAKGGEMPPAGGEASASQGGGTGARGGVAPAPPEPSIEPSKNQSTASSAPALEDQVPRDFPKELRPHGREVMRVLRELASEHPTAKRVTTRAVALAIMAEPHRAYVAEAHRLRAWAASSSRPLRDVVATYRNWLKRADQISGIEPLGQDPTPRPRASSVAANYALIDQMEAAERGGVIVDAEVVGQ